MAKAKKAEKVVKVGKEEMVGQLAACMNATKMEASQAIGHLISIVGEALTQGNTVYLPGLGTFKVAQRKAREGRNPKTGETIKIAAKRAVTFKATKGLV